MIKPKIALSSGLIQNLSRDELEAVVLHESYHLKRLHVFVFLLAELSKALLFFIPIVDTFVNKIKLGLEIKADTEAVTFQGTNAHLRLALVKTITLAPFVDLNPNFSAILLEQRVNRLIKKDVLTPFDKQDLIRTFFITTFLIVMFLFPTSKHTHEKYAEMNIQFKCRDAQNYTSLSGFNITFAY